MTKKNVYVSSTFVDLEKYRLRLKEALERAGYDVVSMEKYPAFDQRPRDKCLADVDQCGYYVLVMAHRYGYVPVADNPQKRSITELEYEEAVSKTKPILAFVISEDQPWPPKMIDAGSLSSESAIGAFRIRVQENHGVRTFTTEENLATAVLEALRAQEEKERLTVTQSVDPQGRGSDTAVMPYNSTVRDLLQIRDAFHAQLCQKQNVIGTAVGRYLIRKADPWPKKTLSRARAAVVPRTLSNSEVRSYSQPCVLVLVSKWSPESFDPVQTIDRVLTLPDGRHAPTCVVLTPFEEPQLGSLVPYSAGPVGGGYPLIAEYQGLQRVASFGCLVKDETALYALTSLRILGPQGQIVTTKIADVIEPVGKSSVKRLGTLPFSAVYPGLSNVDVNLQFETGLVLIDDAKAVTAQVYGIGAPGPIAPVAAGVSALDLLGTRVTAFGAGAGHMTGRIDGLFYRYRADGGTDTICDFLIGPHTADNAARMAAPGNAGTVWLLQGEHGEGFLRPFGCTVPGQRSDSKVSGFTLAVSLGTVTKLLDVELVRDWNTDLTTEWASFLLEDPSNEGDHGGKRGSESGVMRGSRKRRLR